MIYRTAVPGDIDGIMPVISDAKSFLASMGVDQWQDGIPNSDTIKDDIETGNAFVFENNGNIVAFLLFGIGPEKAYDGIFDGRWLTEGTSYGVIHRAAVSDDCRGHGISDMMFKLCEKLSREKGFKSVRLDTHEDNRVMRHIAEKQGYNYCGKMYLKSGKIYPRLGYEKILG